MSCLQILLTLLIPPIPVAMRFGLTGMFWLNLLLWLLGWLPGVVHGFYVLSRPPTPARAA